MSIAIDTYRAVRRQRTIEVLARWRAKYPLVPVVKPATVHTATGEVYTKQTYRLALKEGDS